MITLLPDEVFYPINGYEGIYEISNKQRIKSLAKTWYVDGMVAIASKEDTLLKIYKHKSGYLCVPLTKDGKQRHFKIHRLMANLFIPNPEKLPFINHKNGIKDDNRIENLEWCTPLQNMQHAISTGLLVNKGESCKMSKLKNKDILDIRKRFNDGISYIDLASEYSISRRTIYKITSKQRWSHI